MKLRNERETLLKVAEYLEGGTPNDFENIGRVVFDLAVPAAAASCGTVACIGGCAWIYENPNCTIAEAKNYVGLQGETRLDDLYFPKTDDGFPSNKDYRQITAAEAATAIRRYLIGEEMFWDHVK